MSENTVRKGRRAKNFNVHPNNQVYFKGFASTFKNPVSWMQYRVTVGAFLASLGQKGLASVAVEEIESFCNGDGYTESKIATSRIHIRCLLGWAVKNNVNNFAEKVTRSVLIWLV